MENHDKRYMSNQLFLGPTKGGKNQIILEKDRSPIQLNDHNCVKYPLLSVDPSSTYDLPQCSSPCRYGQRRFHEKGKPN